MSEPSEKLKVFYDRIEAARRAKKAKEEALAKVSAAHEIMPPASEYEDLIPDEGYEKSDDEREMDRIIKSYNIADAYRKWCNKSPVKIRPGQVESIMVSCPRREHRDKEPSAFLNIEKNVFECKSDKCGRGGDIYDVANYHFQVEDIKGSGFPELRKAILEDLGYVVQSVIGGGEFFYKEEPEEDEAPPSSPSPRLSAVPDLDTETDLEPNSEPSTELEPETAPESNVSILHEELTEIEVQMPPLDWRSITPPGTFLDTYMREMTSDDVAEEFHFWNALLAIGFACGRQVRLRERKPVYGNLFICTIGRSGTGKSKANSYLINLLEAALPFDWEDPNTAGVRMISSPGSGEQLVREFERILPDDPSNPRGPSKRYPAKGLIEYDEMSHIMAKARSQGGTLSQYLMQVFDMRNKIQTSAVTTGDKHAVEPFGSTLTTTQIKSVRNILTERDDVSGFLNRWIFAGGPRKKAFAIDENIINLDPSITSLAGIKGWAGSFADDEMMTWTDEAREEFTNYHETFITPLKDSAASDIFARFDLTMKKIALLLSANRLEKSVSAQTVKDMEVISNYLVKSYQIISLELIKNEQTELDRDVLNAVSHYTAKFAKLGRGGTASEIVRHLHRRNYTKGQIHQSLKTHIDLGMIEPMKPDAKKRGPKTVSYVLSQEGA